MDYQPTHHKTQGGGPIHMTTWPMDFVPDPLIGPFFMMLSAVSLEAGYPRCEWENDDKTKNTNYLQIFVKTVDRVDGDEDQGMLLKKKCMESLRDINISYYFGHAQEFDDGGHHYRTMGGLMDFNPTYIDQPLFDSGEPVEHMWKYVFDHGSNVRYMFVSANYLTKSGCPTLYVDDDRPLIPLIQVVTQFGTVNIAMDSILQYNEANLDAIVVDMSKLKRRYLSNRDWHMIEIPEDTLDPSIDGLKVKVHDVKYRILGELGLDVVNGWDHYAIAKVLPKVPKGVQEGATLEQMKDNSNG